MDTAIGKFENQHNASLQMHMSIESMPLTMG